MPDMINHPPHYTSSPAKCSQCGRQIECIDVVEHMPFALGSVVKYLWRHEMKGGIEDLKKAAWYLNREIERRLKAVEAKLAENTNAVGLKPSLTFAEWMAMKEKAALKETLPEPAPAHVGPALANAPLPPSPEPGDVF